MVMWKVMAIGLSTAFGSNLERTLRQIGLEGLMLMVGNVIVVIWLASFGRQCGKQMFTAGRMQDVCCRSWAGRTLEFFIPSWMKL